jgi:uncharacterized protein
MATSKVYDILDCHQHLGAVLGVPGQTGGGADTPLNLDKDTRVAAMDQLGIRQAVLMPAHSYPKPNGLVDTRALNDRLAAYQRLCPDRIAAVVGTIEPRHAENVQSEIDRMRHELGFCGVSWHHRQQGAPIDHPVMHSIIRSMSEVGLIPLIHCHHDVDFEEIWRMRRLAESFPNLKFLCLDSMTHREQFEGALVAGEQTPNIFFDVTSSVMGPEAISRFVDRLGPTRLLFGTNLYSLQRPVRCRELESVLAATIPEDAKHLILGGNARRLFGLKGP